MAVPFALGVVAAAATAVALHVSHGSANSPYPADKAARLESPAAQAQRDHNLPPPTLPPRHSDPPRPVGILEHAPAPFDPHMYALTNMWQQLAGDRYEMAYAGALATDPSQGIIVVITEPVDMLNPPTGSYGGPDIYPTPRHDGGVRFVSFAGSVLTLQAADGTTFEFDASTRAFAG